MNEIQPQISIVLFGPDSQPYLDEARVRLVADDDTAVSLDQIENSHIYRREVAPGRYRLEVAAENLVAPPQDIIVGAEDIARSVYLGEEGWPFYHMGDSLIPFMPREELLAVAYPQRKPEPVETEDADFTARIVDNLPLEPYPVYEAEGFVADADQERNHIIADGAIMVYAFTDDLDEDARGRVTGDLAEMVGGEGRVGMPIDLQPGQAKVMDNQFMVRFQEDIEPQRIQALVEEANGEIVRQLIQAPNLYVLKFNDAGALQSLAIVENWYDGGLLVYGEPDIMAEFRDDVFPYDAPNDPTYTSQANLTLQNVDDAWRILNDIDPKLATGDPNVHVATLDRGIDTDHPDLGGNLTDGTTQMARCFDFSGMRECTVPGYLPDTSHGMGVYGIIAANTNNNNDMAGIAANTHHIGMERPNLTSDNYPDILLWAAGFTTGNTTTGWPAEPLNPGAGVISCSHGVNNLALSSVMNDTFNMLARDGRGGLGTIVIYSAGNDNALVTGRRNWAAHNRTLAIANSAQPDAGGVERKVNSSNFGPEIDVCAQGAGAPSLNRTGGEQTFGGTSAAAPTVAGIVALLLSVNHTLTWRQVRDILRQTAVQIDPANANPVGRWRNGFSQWYGFGRVDAAAAVARARPIEVDQQTDFDGDNTSEIPVTSPWGIGTLKFHVDRLDAPAMEPNGSRFDGWLLNTNDNRFPLMADFDGDGRAELIVTSPWGIGVLNVAGSTYTGTMLAPNGTRFDGWLLNTNDNRFRPAGDYNGDGRAEILVASPWGIGIFRLSGTTFDVPMMAPNGTRFNGWLLNTADNRFGPVGDFDGDGRDEIIVRSPWGIGVFELSGSTINVPMMAPNGTRFNGWLLNTADNHFGPVGDFDGDGRDEILVSSPWGISIFKLSGSTMTVPVMARNGTRFGGWLLNTADNRFWAAADFDGDDTDELFVSSPWGVGILEKSGSTLDSILMGRNGTRFNGWLLNTRDNHFKRFSDLTGNGKADILVTSPWGIGIFSLAGSTFDVPMMAPNGTRFGGWLLNTADNRF